MPYKNTLTLEEVAALLKMRGFIFPSSEIYGGLSAAYDYGPLGVELKMNIMQSWWDFFVRNRSDVYGLDTAIFMNPKVWQASGHTEHFTDPLMDCKKCRHRFRPDKLVEEFLRKKKKSFDSVDMGSLPALQKAVHDLDIACPDCGSKDWTDVREFNNLFETHQGVIKDSESLIYLRGEIAQGMFVNFKNVMQSTRAKLPFGIAQQGKAFRNEVTVKRYIFRTREFNLMEIEYFASPDVAQKQFASWKEDVYAWYTDVLKLDVKNLSWREQTEQERAHYSAGTFDLEYNFPWGFDEIGAIAYRTDFDLANHQKHSGQDLSVVDPETNKKFIPHVIEPTFGIDRALLAVIMNALEVVPGGRGGDSKHDKEIVMHLDPKFAPIQIAVLPLSKKSELIIPANEIFKDLTKSFRTEFDATQSIGKRYRRQDEIGTPYCITFDFDSLEDKKVTVRDRDTMQQERIAITSLTSYFHSKFNS